ncbi:hypothetical protein EVAR_75442_1 [Eumeta japonica]|uniref:Uncharacterized protein n=1 Tax=Eumeta variegata TaxID=151549 RepID=A0A4C1TN05_EUMVA|nr:hypothetical protein EVAR_75442_1 [Eumeta japonica]
MTESSGRKERTHTLTETRDESGSRQTLRTRYNERKQTRGTHKFAVHKSILSAEPRPREIQTAEFRSQFKSSRVARPS